MPAPARQLLRPSVIAPLLLAIACGASTGRAPTEPPPKLLAPISRESAAVDPSAALLALGEAGSRALSATEIEAHARFLSSDLLEGRGTATRGHELAAAYVAAQFRSLGLEAAGSGGSYFQEVPLRVSKRLDRACELSVVGKKRFKLRTDHDVVFVAFPGREKLSLRGELVYAGFGLTAPEFQYDDLAGVDVRGKIVLFFWGAPRTKGAFFPGVERAVYSDRALKAAKLKSLGALATLQITSPELYQLHPWSAAVHHFRFERIDWMSGAEPGAGAVLPGSVLSKEGTDKLLTEATPASSYDALWAEAASGNAKARSLGVTVELQLGSTFTQKSSPNVLGLLRGSDEALAREMVLVTAHLDHMGIGEPRNGDSIYNGAVDNAAGVATMLAVARAFASMPQKPKRSILFLATTGEEKNLAGSDYFANHPTVPLSDIVANINLDAPNPMHEMFDVVPLGADHSTLRAHVETAAKAMGIGLSPDPAPEHVLFIRSDQYSFVKKGIVALFPLPGYRDAEGQTQTKKNAMEHWMETRYHAPSDEWQPEYRADFLAKEARFHFLVALSVASALERPRFNPGDFFERHRF